MSLSQLTCRRRKSMPCCFVHLGYSIVTQVGGCPQWSIATCQRTLRNRQGCTDSANASKTSFDIVESEINGSSAPLRQSTADIPIQLLAPGQSPRHCAGDRKCSPKPLEGRQE